MTNRDEQPGTPDIGCMQAIEALYAYLDGELDDPAARREFEHHMTHCRSCFTRAEIEGLLTERIRDLAAEKAPRELQNRLRKLMQEF